MTRNPGKWLESAARRIRPYLSPRYRRAYRELARRGMAQRRPGEPIVCCDFANPAIDAVGGRYYFSLVRDLIDAGYFPVFTLHRSTVSTFGVSRMKEILLGERLGVVSRVEDLAEPFVLLTDGRGPRPALATRVIRVGYEWRCCGGCDELAFPVFVHPQLAGETPLPFAYDPAAVRPLRVFFGGNTERGKYDQPVIRKLYQMLNRREMLDAAVAAFPEDQICRPQGSPTWLDEAGAGGIQPLMICETQHAGIPRGRWLEALARADFFLACPGVGMPLCHNLAEALAAGSVPILQYGGYLSPPLQDGVNCLAFKDAADLQRVLNRVAAMSQDEIQALRIRVGDYYQRFMAPGQFARRLCDGPPQELCLWLNDYRVPR